MGGLSALSGGSPAQGNPMGYVRSDRNSTVIYRGTDNHLHELGLGGSGWEHNDITYYTGLHERRWRSLPTWSDASIDGVDHPFAGPSGSPFGRRATSNTDSVVYLGTDANIYEQRLGLTGTWSFSTD